MRTAVGLSHLWGQAVLEALVTNYQPIVYQAAHRKYQQAALFEAKAAYQYEE
jgi:hypothetical protein